MACRLMLLWGLDKDLNKFLEVPQDGNRLLKRSEMATLGMLLKTPNFRTFQSTSLG